ncbi:hypothetical protein [Flavobacterium sp.]|uniref:hypothetical protein n=1 Tax=Flavobacterium sp. TaxID=239 RepID=UPI0039E59433
MKKYFLLLLVIFSCQQSRKETTAQDEPNESYSVEDNPPIEEAIFVKNSLHRKFFESDKIDHYYLDISEEDANDILAIENKSDNQKILASLLMSSYPEKIPDNDLESNLKKFKFIKTELNQKRKTQVENIFSEQDSIQNVFSGCIPYYRDIFIFKKNDSIVGISKVCFGCGVSQFRGTKINTEGFGLHSELEKLEKIIRNK